MLRVLAIFVIVYELGSPPFADFRPARIGAPFEMVYRNVNDTAVSGIRETAHMIVKATSFINLRQNDDS